MFQYVVEPERVLEGWLKESSNQRARFGIWWTNPRNLCTSMQKRHRQEGVLFWLQGTFLRLLRSLPPSSQLILEDILATILDANPDAFFECGKPRDKTYQGQSGGCVCTRPSRVGFGFRPGGVNWSYFEETRSRTRLLSFETGRGSGLMVFGKPV